MTVLRRIRSPALLFPLIAAAVALGAWLAASSATFAQSPRALSAAIMFDLGVFVPAAYWALVVRRRLAPARTMIPVVALGLLAASAIVPAQHAGLIAWGRHLALPAEIGLVGYVAWKVRAMLRTQRARGDADPLEAASAALESAIGAPAPARILASEFAMMYYALAPRRSAAHVPRGTIAFAPETQAIILGVLGPLVVLETALVHLVVSMWSPGIAWALTALSAYTMLWLIGDFRAMRRRPTLVGPEEIVVRVGLRCTIRADRSLIQRIGPANWKDAALLTPGMLNLASPGTPNVRIEFCRPIAAKRIFGVTVQATGALLRLADGEAFVRAVRA